MSANHHFNRLKYREELGGTIIDEDDLVENGLTIIEGLPEHQATSHSRRPRYELSPAQIDAMFVRGGYDPHAIPDRLRIPALEVMWCWEKKLVDPDDIVFVVDRNPAIVRAAIRALNAAYQPQPGR